MDSSFEFEGEPLQNEKGSCHMLAVTFDVCRWIETGTSRTNSEIVWRQSMSIPVLEGGAP